MKSEKEIIKGLIEVATEEQGRLKEDIEAQFGVVNQIHIILQQPDVFSQLLKDSPIVRYRLCNYLLVALLSEVPANKVAKMLEVDTSERMMNALLPKLLDRIRKHFEDEDGA